MTAAKTESVRKELVVKVARQRAFQAFTEKIDRWWPRSHHIGRVEMKQAVLETKDGGRWYEIGVDGTECNWGRVLVWDPPRRLVLAWQITAGWQYDPDFVTEVEINFAEEGPTLTRVTLEHRNIGRFGVQAEAMWNSFDSDGGWSGMLAAFGRLAEDF